MRLLHPLLSVFTVSYVLGHAKALAQDRRSVVDLCANVDGHVKLPGIAKVKLDLCLCISAIPALISTNLQLRTATHLLGTSTVTAAIAELVNDADDKRECTSPDHSVPHCNRDDPCGFTCTDGFTPEPSEDPTTCVCNGTVCNGICGSSPCSSQRAKRSPHWGHTTCPHGWRVCGIWGSSNFGYECVDVRRDLWSCGGCGVPLLQTDPTGVDCTAIPEVVDVACLASRCVVQRCKEGFEISPDQTTCVPIPCPRIPSNSVFLNNEEGSPESPTH